MQLGHLVKGQGYLPRSLQEVELQLAMRLQRLLHCQVMRRAGPPLSKAHMGGMQLSKAFENMRVDHAKVASTVSSGEI